MHSQPKARAKPTLDLPRNLACSGFRVQGLGFRVQGSGFRGLEFSLAGTLSFLEEPFSKGCVISQAFLY